MISNRIFRAEVSVVVAEEEDDAVVDAGHPPGQHPSSHAYRKFASMYPHIGPLVESPVIGVIPGVGCV